MCDAAYWAQLFLRGFPLPAYSDVTALPRAARRELSVVGPQSGLLSDGIDAVGVILK